MRRAQVAAERRCRGVTRNDDDTSGCLVTEPGDDEMRRTSNDPRDDRTGSRAEHQPEHLPAATEALPVGSRPVQRPVRWNEAVDQAWSTQGGRWLVAACWVVVPTVVILGMIFGTWTH